MVSAKLAPSRYQHLYRLPGGCFGFQIAERLRKRKHISVLDASQPRLAHAQLRVEASKNRCNDEVQDRRHIAKHIVVLVSIFASRALRTANTCHAGCKLIRTSQHEPRYKRLRRSKQPVGVVPRCRAAKVLQTAGPMRANAALIE